MTPATGYIHIYQHWLAQTVPNLHMDHIANVCKSQLRTHFPREIIFEKILKFANGLQEFIVICHGFYFPSWNPVRQKPFPYLPCIHISESPTKRNPPSNLLPAPSQQHRRVWSGSYSSRRWGQSRIICYPEPQSKQRAAMTVLHVQGQTAGFQRMLGCILIHWHSCDGKLPSRQSRCWVHADKCIPIVK